MRERKIKMIKIYRPSTSDRNVVNEVVEAIISNLNEVKTPSKVRDRLVNLIEAKSMLDDLYITTLGQVERLEERETETE